MIRSIKRHYAVVTQQRMRGSTMVEYVVATGILLGALLVPFGDDDLSALQRLLFALRAEHSSYMYMAGLPSLPRDDGTGGPIPPGAIGSGGGSGGGGANPNGNGDSPDGGASAGSGGSSGGNGWGDGSGAGGGSPNLPGADDLELGLQTPGFDAANPPPTCDVPGALTNG